MNINKQYASQNYWEGNNPKSIMLHTTGGGSVVGAVDTLIARGLSYNYIIARGVVYELADHTKSCWHAGVIRKPNLRSQAFYGTLKGAENPNRNSIGISFIYPEGDITQLDDESIDACVFLIKYIGSKTGIRYNADNIFYHQEVTVDKPIMVKGYRTQILDALIGDKDEKDAMQKTITQLLLKVAQLKLQLLLQKLNLLKA